MFDQPDGRVGMARSERRCGRVSSGPGSPGWQLQLDPSLHVLQFYFYDGLPVESVRLGKATCATCSAACLSYRRGLDYLYHSACWVA